MSRIRKFCDRQLKKFAALFGYTMLNESDLSQREKEFVEPAAALKVAPGVKLLALRVWTEGEHSCQHVYRKVKALNSHRNAVGKASGKSEHADYVCSECTHKMCATRWSDA